MDQKINYRGKVISWFGHLAGSNRLQPILEGLQLLTLAGMNVGGATYCHDASGEVEAMRYIHKLGDKDQAWTIFDVGAHKGDYAKKLREVFGSRTRILCFEPSPSLFSKLESNVLSAQCELFNVAFSDYAGTDKLFAGKDSIPSILSPSFEIMGQEVVSEEAIDKVRLDDFCSENNIERVDFIKVDVEGYEFKVLCGAGSWISDGQIDFVQFELGPHAIASRTYFRDFFELLSPSYSIFRILRKGIREIKNYHLLYEQFSSATNYLAISKKKLGIEC